MDLLTLSTILAAQLEQFNQIFLDIRNISANIYDLSTRVDEEPTLKPQIKAFVDAIYIQMTAMNSQETIVQRIIDEIAQLVN